MFVYISFQLAQLWLMPWSHIRDRVLLAPHGAQELKTVENHCSMTIYSLSRSDRTTDKYHCDTRNAIILDWIWLQCIVHQLQRDSLVLITRAFIQGLNVIVKHFFNTHLGAPPTTRSWTVWCFVYSMLNGSRLTRHSQG